MKSSLSSAAFSLFLGVAVLLVTVDRARAATALEQAMKQMSEAYKELSADLKQPQDTAKDQYLALAATIKDQAKASRDLVHKLAQSLPADQRDTMVQSYQKDMDKFMQDVDSLSGALKNGRWDDARKWLTTLHQEMSDGHKQYRAQKGGPSQPPAPPSTPPPAPAPPAQ